jgi:hypothetical protein
MQEGEPLALGWLRDSVSVIEYHLRCLDLASVFTINDRNATTEGCFSRSA